MHIAATRKYHKSTVMMATIKQPAKHKKEQSITLISKTEGHGSGNMFDIGRERNKAE